MLEPHLAPINTLQIPLAKVTQPIITGRQRSFTATAADPSALPSNPFGPSLFETPPEVQPVQELTWLPFQGRVAVAAPCAAVMYTQRLVRRSHRAEEPPGNPEDDQHLVCTANQRVTLGTEVLLAVAGPMPRRWWVTHAP